MLRILALVLERDGSANHFEQGRLAVLLTERTLALLVLAPGYAGELTAPRGVEACRFRAPSFTGAAK